MGAALWTESMELSPVSCNHIMMSICSHYHHNHRFRLCHLYTFLLVKATLVLSFLNMAVYVSPCVHMYLCVIASVCVLFLYIYIVVVLKWCVLEKIRLFLTYVFLYIYIEFLIYIHFNNCFLYFVAVFVRCAQVSETLGLLLHAVSVYAWVQVVKPSVIDPQLVTWYKKIACICSIAAGAFKLDFFISIY